MPVNNRENTGTRSYRSGHDSPVERNCNPSRAPSSCRHRDPSAYLIRYYHISINVLVKSLFGYSASLPSQHPPKRRQLVVSAEKPDRFVRHQFSSTRRTVPLFAVSFWGCTPRLWLLFSLPKIRSRIRPLRGIDFQNTLSSNKLSIATNPRPA